MAGCQSSADKKAGDHVTTPTSSDKINNQPFRLISGNTAGDSAVFEAADIVTTIANTGSGMQTIHIMRQGKRLINYMRAVDTGNNVIPTPQLHIAGTDTAVVLNVQRKDSSGPIIFKIKNNKATHNRSEKATKKAPADAGAF
ncbi:hypothetical protein [Chitinophaga sp. 212800010-3]|uniref:hypothetical protein n=1 Tax=unclassified Chitinophaga TaxID=2619133 RepID=UPI002DF14831|nr:DUF2846 domain-containing protein [Chitinophaga sp. 212800010-3]